MARRYWGLVLLLLGCGSTDSTESSTDTPSSDGGIDAEPDALPGTAGNLTPPGDVSATPVPVTLTVTKFADVNMGAPENGLVVDDSGTLLVPDVNYSPALNANYAGVWKVDATGKVAKFVGLGAAGYMDATGEAAQFASPRGVALDKTGNLFVTDSGNFRVRKVTPAGVVTTFAGGTLTSQVDGTGTNVGFSGMNGLTIDPSGNLFLTDINTSNPIIHRIRALTPGALSSTPAGGAQGYSEGNGASALFKFPRYVAADGDGNVYILDTQNYRVRKMTPGKDVTTLAGSGTNDSVDGVGAGASFTDGARGIAVDASGNVYVTESRNAFSKIRRIRRDGTVTTLVGGPTKAVIDGDATTAAFLGPGSIAIGPTGDFFIRDNNLAIRKMHVVGIGALKVSWSASAGGVDVAGYEVAVEADGLPTKTCSTKSELTCWFTGLISGVKYRVTVTAVANSLYKQKAAPVEATPN